MMTHDYREVDEKEFKWNEEMLYLDVGQHMNEDLVALRDLVEETNFCKIVEASEKIVLYLLK